MVQSPFRAPEPPGWSAENFGDSQSDREKALRLALELHKQGQGVSRTADAVILSACRFLTFIGDPQKAMAEASIARVARRAVALLHKIGHSPALGNGDRALLTTMARELSDALRQTEPEEEPAPAARKP